MAGHWLDTARVDDRAIDAALREHTDFQGEFDNEKQLYSAFAWAQVSENLVHLGAIGVAVEVRRDPPREEEQRLREAGEWENAMFKGYSLSGADANALLGSLVHWTGLVLTREQAIAAGGLTSPRHHMGRSGGEVWLGAADRLQIGVKLPASDDWWLTPAEVETLRAEVDRVQAEHERQRSAYTGPSNAEIMRRHREDLAAQASDREPADSTPSVESSSPHPGAPPPATRVEPSPPAAIA